jgi:uncharacterized protein YkwD
VRQLLLRAPLGAVLAVALAGCGMLDRTPPEVATACGALPPPDPAHQRPIEAGGIDQWLLSEAVLREVNEVRCDRGLAPLAYDEAVTRAAAYHSGDMVTRGFFGHESPVSGRATPSDRLDQVGAAHTRAAENLARTSIFAFDGRTFYIRDQDDCVFSLTPEGPPIPRRTYASAAERLVEGWMDSPGHRRNILDPEMSRHGAAAAARPDPATCGELLVTQVLAS